MKNFTNNFKQFTSRLSARWLIMALMLLVGTSSAWAGGGAGGPMGVYLGVNGNNTWYKINGVNSWNMSCSGYAFDNANALPSSLGNITSGLSLEGLGIIGWTDSGSDWVAGKINYTITPGSKSGSYETGNFDNPSWGNGGHVRCSSGNNRVTAVKSSINLIDGLGAGDYTLKFEYFARMQWQNNNGNGYYDDNNGNARGTKSATFTIPGYSTTTGEKSFGEVEVNSSSDYTIELTHYGSDNTATVSITGTNKSEFTATVTKSGDNKQILIVTFKPTSVAQDKTATIKVTDAYNKTYTLNVTGTGKQSCQAPTSVSITRSDAPSTANICQGSTLNLTADVSGGNGDIKYEWEQVDGTDWSVSANSTEQTCTVKAGTGIAHFKIKATQCEETVEATIELTADAKPSLELASSPTVCPNVQIDLDNYVNPSTIGTVTWYYEGNRTNVITDGLVTPTEQTTYYASASNGVCESDEGELIVKVYGVPEDIPAYTLTNATSCKDDPNSDGSIVLKNAIGGIIYQLDGIGGTEWINLAAGTHKLSATVDACSSLTREWDIEVGEEDITPSATITISGETSFCEGTSTELTCVVNATKGNPTAYQWYNGDNLIQDAINSTYSARAEGNYKVVVTVLNSTCQDEFWSDEKVVTINPKPNEPVLSIPSPICAGSNFTLPEEDNKQRNITWNVNDRELTNLTAGTHNYTAKIIDVNGCESNEVTYTITVTALPEITSISQDIQEPVFYEDVTLTANATQGATVKWYEGGVEKATGATYVVTSETATSKDVTAKAFLNGCESAVASHTVVFSAETCNNVADMTKIYLDVSENTGFITGNNAYVSVTASGNKSANCSNTDGANTGNYKPKSDTWWGTMTKVAGENYIYEITIPNNVTINKGTTKLSFWNKSISGYDDVYQVQAILGQTISAGTNCMKLSNANKTNNNSRQSDFYCGTWVTYANKPAISAPAVKTVSFETTPGDGNINFSGQIVKTGCDNSLTYGYEYKKVGAANWTQVVLGTDLDKDAGFTFSDNNDKDLDGEYVVRAFITNDNSTQYGAEITKELSTTKDPVTEATITLTDAEGTPVANDKKYCVGETAYIKVESDVKYIDISWKSQQGVDIVQTRLMNMYQFVVKGNDNIVVLLSNKYNVTPAESNTIEVNTFADPILPRVSLNKVSICSNDEVGATVKLTNVVKGQTYQLYQQIDNGDDTFTEQAIGEAKTQTEEVTDKSELVLHTLNNTYTTGKYFVKTYTSDCEENKVATQPFTFTVVDAAEVFISIDPASAETTPWMPAKFTVNASDKYTLNVTKGNPAEPATEVEVNQNGNKVSVKIPLPEGTQHVTGQYQNVTFPQGATTQYTITATLSATGGDNPCAAPTSATINLVPYVEECTIGH